MYNGVNPFCDCAFTEAPRCTSNCTTSSCPAERIYRCHTNYSQRDDASRHEISGTSRASKRNKCLFKIIRVLVPYAFNERRGSYERMSENERDREMRMCARLPREAMCNAVFPFLVAASTIAPRFRSSLTISKWPSLAARCKAFKPFCNI